jgi:hypothetical protein
MMNKARDILMQILAILGSSEGKEREVDDFCTWIEVQIMTELFEALPPDKQEQAVHQFVTLPPHKKESVFYPYYSVEFMRERVQKATKTAIVQQFVEPRWHKLSAAQHESILALLDKLT